MKRVKSLLVDKYHVRNQRNEAVISIIIMVLLKLTGLVLDANE